MLTVISIIILIFSVILHEVSHGYMADVLGDPTARLQGRLTLNPLKHIDPFGSVIFPLLLVVSHAGFVFGWAKPVIYNPFNLKNKRRGEFLIAIAGPASNLLIAIIFSVIIRLLTGGFSGATGAMELSPFVEICTYVVAINIVLAVFNLIPIPPLDGSKLLLAWLPQQYGKVRLTLERFGPFLVLIVVLFVWQLIYPIIPYVFSFFTGLST